MGLTLALANLPDLSVVMLGTKRVLSRYHWSYNWEIKNRPQKKWHIQNISPPPPNCPQCFLTAGLISQHRRHCRCIMWDRGAPAPRHGAGRTH